MDGVDGIPAPPPGTAMPRACMLPGMAAKLHVPPQSPGLRGIAARFGVLLAVLLIVVIVLYAEGGLIDTRTEKAPGFADCVYFVLVTITTVGYGDIVPVTTASKFTDALFLTPVRFFAIFIFVGTAYQLVIKQFQEEYRMKRAMEKLTGHVVLCGFGNTGRVAAQELFLQDTSPDQIVALDVDEDALNEASEMGIVAVNGDATREHVLRSVAIERAAYVLVCPGRDDTAVLISLTARDLNPAARVIAMCLDEENVRLLSRGGAQTIISRSSAGGNLMAAATRHVHLVETMQDILSLGGALKLEERPVSPDEAGKRPAELPGIALLRVYRGDRHYDVTHLPALQSGDTIVYVAASGGGGDTQ